MVAPDPFALPKPDPNEIAEHHLPLGTKVKILHQVVLGRNYFVLPKPFSKKIIKPNVNFNFFQHILLEHQSVGAQFCENI